MRRVIVTADDFGLSSSANHAVIQAHQQGILTCASLMVNEAGFDEAVSLARANPRLGVGLHLTLVDGHSTLGPAEVPGLVSNDRQFAYSPVVAGCRYAVLRGLRPQLRAEIKAQVAKFRATGLPLDHVNSHHHIHAHPVIFKALVELASDLGITRIRLPCEPSAIINRLMVDGEGDRLKAGLRTRTKTIRRLDLLFHRVMARRARPILKRAAIRHNDYIFGLSHTGRVDEACLKQLIPLLPEGVSEIYSHPSLDRFRYELDALLSNSVRQLIKTHRIELIRFGDL
jgi:hopanoid biosynthesis associated protein HpnK